MVLLEMEQSLRAQEKVGAGTQGKQMQKAEWIPSFSGFPLMQLLWDLELLTGVGLGLFWPPWAGSYGQRVQTQHSWNQRSQSWGRNLDGDSEQLVSRGTM